MKDLKHIKRFNESEENLNISDVSSSFRGMSVKQLIEHLSKFDDNVEVMILDGFNGQGNKRTINFTPSNLQIITPEDEETGSDCNDKVGNKVVLLGYGCY